MQNWSCLIKMKTYGLRIDTSVGAGRYQHKVFEIGINARNRHDAALSDKAVQMLERALEQIYLEMPEGSQGLTATVKYRAPTKRK